MIKHATRRTLTWLLVGLAALAGGCETGFVQDAARTNLASFMTDIFSTAVNTAIAGD